MRYYDIELLQRAGYTVIEQSPWHFQIEGHVLLNIWPTKKKYMVQYDKGASFYTNIVETVESILGKPGEVTPKITIAERIRREYEAAMTDDDRCAYLEWQIWRKEFSDEILYEARS